MTGRIATLTSRGIWPQPDNSHLMFWGVVKKRVTRYMSDWVSAPVGSWSKQAGDPPYGCG